MVWGRQLLPGRPAYPGEHSRVWATDVATDFVVVDLPGLVGYRDDRRRRAAWSGSVSLTASWDTDTVGWATSTLFIRVRTAKMNTVDIGGDLTVRRLGFYAMRITGEEIDGEPATPEAARDVLRRAADTVDLVDTECGPRPA